MSVRVANNSGDAESEKLARLRILEEAKIVESTTRQRRKLQQRQLIGPDAECIQERGDRIEDAKRLWSAKGKTTAEEGGSESRLEVHGTNTIESSAVSRAKAKYQDSLQNARDKGKSTDHLEAGETEEVPALDDLKARYDRKPKPTPAPKQDLEPSAKPKNHRKLSSLFRRKTKTKEPTTEPIKEKDNTAMKAGQVTGYGNHFETIESEEVTMVGNEKHVKVTGIDKSGRRIIRTKIVLPSVVGETQHQRQQRTG